MRVALARMYYLNNKWSQAFNNVTQQHVRSMMSVSTQRAYYLDTYQASITATVLSSGKDDDGVYFIPDKTVFHPQGGGQPSDSGTVKFGEHSFNVIKLAEDGEAIKHYVDGELHSLMPKEAILTINLANRKLYARIHSAGHLLSDVVNQKFPELTGYRGNHFPGGKSFVVFKGTPHPDKQVFKEAVLPALTELIKKNGDVTTHNSKGDRQVQMPGFKALSCGGTHVLTTGEILEITIRSIKKDKGDLKVGYNVI